MKNTTRKNTPPIKVYCLPHERDEIKALAAASGKTASRYLLAVGMGYRPKNILDHRCVEELAKINGDLGRLGGLLKLWITNDERTAGFGEPTIRALLSKITEAQSSMHEVMRKVVLPKS
jgi:hypothetical protein